VRTGGRPSHASTPLQSVGLPLSDGHDRRIPLLIRRSSLLIVGLQELWDELGNREIRPVLVLPDEEYHVRINVSETGDDRL